MLGDLVLMWNYVIVYLYGMLEILSEEENYVMFIWFIDYFEDGREYG